jgi:hypothetical protein
MRIIKFLGFPFASLSSSLSMCPHSLEGYKFSLTLEIGENINSEMIEVIAFYFA